MNSEAADYLCKARHCLADARRIAAAEVPDVAAREAYLAASMQPRRTFSSEPAKRSKRIVASGASSTDWRTRAPYRQRAPHLPRRRLQIQNHCRLGIGSAIGTISAHYATTAIDTAERFIDTIVQLLAA